MMSRAPGREGEERFLLDSTRKSDGCPHAFATGGVTSVANCGISNVGHAVRGLFSGLQSPSGPPKAFDSCPSGRP